MTLMTSLLLASFAGSAWIGCPVPVPAEPEFPWTPSPRREDYPWMSRVEWCERFQAQLQDPARGQAQLVFMGDSITQGWTEKAPEIWTTEFGSRQPLRLGIGGDRTQNVLWRIDQGELSGLNPRVLVLLIGINNLSAGDSPDATTRGIHKVIERIRIQLPQTWILVLGILPSGRYSDDPLRADILRTNQKLLDWQEARMSYHDVGSIFLLPDGSINEDLMPDFLHPSPEGYQQLAHALQPILAPLFGTDVINVGPIKEDVTLPVP
ncbi:MAG TPA: GDSL-type esterase/lipase family protein [Oligoflexus sp.]|uniref:GDSL-type esterase/lipase family protein n=1 Tax=Oligoflexus sp. TaxID=1971216 RepID=UPI002D397DEA|nr:GDSL-type esterase/lipase family protein [Oligoflexus sp.]HYX32971.1 GDSL-type esterase/lipase family protein [Oligoflexus sp.]